MQNYAIERHGDAPVTQKIREDQVKNSAGGYVFSLSPLARLRRFLILGADSSTYYVRKQVLVKDNYDSLLRALKDDYKAAIDLIVEVSVNGLAPKVDPQIFALAVASVDSRKDVRKYALSKLNEVCRTGTHLFVFLEYRKQLGGRWGSLIRSALKKWYGQNPDRVALQVIKYRNREGWTHIDALRVSHVRPLTEQHNATFAFAKDGKVLPNAPAIIGYHMRAANAKSVGEVLEVIKERPDLPRESIPTEFLKDKELWRAMLPQMPLMATVRNIRNMESYGVFDKRHKDILVEKLTNEDAIRKSLIHPVHYLLAMGAYSGDSDQIKAALDSGFRMAFGNVEPTGKRIMIALDISSSMSWGEVATGVTPAMGSCAMAMVTVEVEDCDVFGFSTSLRKLDIKPNWSIGKAVQYTQSVGFGGTNAAAPMQYALKHGLKYDAFVVYTDCETWSSEHPFKVLQKYRDNTGINAALIVVGMTSTGFSIADPNDPKSLDVVGFDASAPQIISQTISS